MRRSCLRSWLCQWMSSSQAAAVQASWSIAGIGLHPVQHGLVGGVERRPAGLAASGVAVLERVAASPYPEPMADPDLRWRQRFDNFQRALQVLQRGVALAQQRPLSELEQQGLIQGFAFTHELAWNLLKDYLHYQGISGIIGSRDATRLAFQSGLLGDDGEGWMAMIKARNQSLHTYNLEQAQAIASDVVNRYAPLLGALRDRFLALSQRPG